MEKLTGSHEEGLMSPAPLLRLGSVVDGRQSLDGDGGGRPDGGVRMNAGNPGSWRWGHCLPLPSAVCLSAVGLCGRSVAGCSEQPTIYFWLLIWHGFTLLWNFDIGRMFGC